MGATNGIKGTNLSLQLEGKECPQCQQIFNQQEIDKENYDIWFDTTNDVKLTPMEELKDDAYYKPFGRTGYELTIWIRSIEHEDCPNIERCQGCYSKFKREELKIKESYFYCANCQSEHGFIKEDYE